MLNPDWPLALRLVIVAVAILASALSFSLGSVAFGVLFIGLSAWTFKSLFMAPPGG
jgi:hypothetical protein